VHTEKIISRTEKNNLAHRKKIIAHIEKKFLKKSHADHAGSFTRPRKNSLLNTSRAFFDSDSRSTVSSIRNYFDNCGTRSPTRSRTRPRKNSLLDTSRAFFDSDSRSTVSSIRNYFDNCGTRSHRRSRTRPRKKFTRDLVAPSSTRTRARLFPAERAESYKEEQPASDASLASRHATSAAAVIDSGSLQKYYPRGSGAIPDPEIPPSRYQVPIPDPVVPPSRLPGAHPGSQVLASRITGSRIPGRAAPTGHQSFQGLPNRLQDVSRSARNWGGN
jgi:hypothetical protein